LAGWPTPAPITAPLQLDVYGEALDAILTGDNYGLPINHAGWQAQSRLSADPGV
jgi:hypothetical protein